MKQKIQKPNTKKVKRKKERLVIGEKINKVTSKFYGPSSKLGKML